jgi:hypothetical protein
MQTRIPEFPPPAPVPAFAYQPAPLASTPAAPAELELPPAIRDLVDRCAAFHRGLAFVHRAPPECVAAALGVTVPLVECTRAALELGPERVALIRAHAAAVERRRRLPPAPVPTCTPPRRGAEDVVREAEGHALGVQFLLCAPFETAAIAFGVHPDVVLEARELLARRGVAPEAPEP